MYRNTLIIISIFFVALLLLKSWRLTQRYGGTDLRCRIVGARNVFTGHSPYFYKWNPADGDFFLDPNDKPERRVNGTVVTPALLLITYPLAALPYAYVRSLWTLLQLLLMAGTVLLVIKASGKTNVLLPALVVIDGLICSDVFLYNIERGQVYIFYTFLLSLIYYLCQTRRNYFFLSGLVSGVFAFMRPMSVVICVGFVLKNKQRWLIGYFAGIISGLILFVAPARSMWNDYFVAMKEYTETFSGRENIITNPVRPSLPALIEGMSNLRVYSDFTTGSLSSFSIYAAKAGILIGPGSSFCIYTVVTVVLSLFFYLKRDEALSNECIFLFAFLLYILAELFIIAPRGSYNLAQWAFPLLVISIKFWHKPSLIVVMAASLLLLHGFPFHFAYMFELAEMLLIGILLYAVYLPGHKRHTANIILP